MNCEKTLKRRIITFPLLLLQLYPQYRSMRILWWAFVRKNATKALKEKHHHESSLSNVGKCSGKPTYIIGTYSCLPNKRTYVRSCSGKIFPLCTQLLGTLYAQCTVGFGAKMFQSRKLHQRWKIVLTRNVDYMPINKVSYNHTKVDSQFLNNKLRHY